MRGLYAIIDADFLNARGVPLIPFAEQVIAGGPAAVQLRAKHSNPREVLEWLRRLKHLCAAREVPLFANDRPDLALLADCHGVHVGQSDLAVSDVRRFAPELRVGVSTHHEGELLEALAERPDYVAFGPVFATTSKERADPVVGVEGLSRAAERCREAGVPLVAIGGIDVARASQIGAISDMGAVIGALLPDQGLEGVAARVRELAARFR